MTDAITTLGDLRAQTNEDYLEHFGIKGMHWGVRHQVGADGRVGKSGVVAPIDHAAKTDAATLAKAIHQTGSGSVLARRSIRNTIETKSAQSPEYKKALNYHKSREEDKYLLKQVAKAVAPEVIIGSAWLLYHFNGYTLKVNGPLLQNSSKAIATGAKVAAKFGPQLVNDYKFRQITKGF